MKKVMKNVLISVGDNKLQLSDVVYDDKIISVKSLTQHFIEWDDISTQEKRDQVISKIIPSETHQSDSMMDRGFNLLMPGAIDAHVHFNTPGFEDREDFEHGTLAAAHGGVTTIIDMPCTSLPPVTSVENLHYKLKAINGRSFVDYAMWGGVSGNDYDSGKDIPQQVTGLHKVGVVGFKTYVISGMETFTDLSYDYLLKTAKHIASIGGIMAVHAEDKQTVLSKKQTLLDANKNDWSDYCEARSIEAEVKAVTRMIEISRETGCRVHIVHLSSAEALIKINEAQSHGMNITTETCPHYLYFTQEDFKNPEIRNYLKTAPPVKFNKDRESLWEGLRDGTISFVTTDHAGCNPATEKTSMNFWEVYGGIPGVEHRVPFLFSEGLLKRDLTISKIIDLLSSNVADYFGLASKGKIEKGKDADFALIDLWDSMKVSADDMHSKGKYTPFQNVVFNAVVKRTILRGNIIAGKDISISPAFGKFIHLN